MPERRPLEFSAVTRKNEINRNRSRKLYEFRFHAGEVGIVEPLERADQSGLRKVAHDASEL
jgi:RNA polymerase-interacting CarD/CdnL/TRCF family regulator